MEREPMKIKKLLLSIVLSSSLTACGGGGGGSVVTAVSNFINNDVTNLAGSESIINSYSNLLSNFNFTVTSGDLSSLSGILTKPTEEDQTKAQSLLIMLNQAETLWNQTEQLILNQSDSAQYKIYNSNSYKEAYAALLYLRNYVKPVITKVSNGAKLTETEFNLVAKESKAEEIINTEKNNSAKTYAEAKKIKSTETISNETSSFVDTVGESEATTSEGEWKTINAGGGQENRLITTITPNYRTTTIQNCTLVRKTLLNGDVINGAETCTTTGTTITELDPTISEVTETREGENPIETSVTLDPIVNAVTETGDEYIVTNYADAEDTNTITTNGTAVTTTKNVDVVTDVNNDNNTTTRTTVRFIETTVTTPVTTTVTRTRTYTDITRQNSRTVTTTTPQTKVTYKDNTSETIQGVATVLTGDWQINQISTAKRTEERIVSESTANTILTSRDSGTLIAQVTITNSYTDNDSTLGSKTANMSTVISDHETDEYKLNRGLKTIKASSAYARGWTGKDSVLGVIDTWQDINHSELKNKYKWYNDYTRYESTVSDKGKNQYHGTHVAGIIAAKNDGVGMHGVAYDAELVGANVDYYGRGGISLSRAQQALHDFAKLKNPDGENMNIVAVNMSFNTPHLFLSGSGSTVTQLSDGTYNASEVTAKKEHGDYAGKYWKVATDNDIILVNSAGNYGFPHAGSPGIWATETNANDELVLGGKMLIVGNWNEGSTNVSGNKAGHVCLDINSSNNTCNDTYKISDFYILAPGDDIKSTTPTDMGGSTYMNSSGTSMSAPHVTGALGVLNQMWPHMKGENLVRLVLNTANKDLINYNVNVHGQGLLDLNEATKPQGATGIPTTGRTNGPIVNVYGTYFATGSSLPSSLSNLKVMILDEYERDYYVNLGNSISIKDTRKISDINIFSNQHTYLPLQQMYGSFSQGGQYHLDKINFGFYSGENGKGDFSANVGKHFELTDKIKLKTSIGMMNEYNTWLGNSSDGIFSVGEDNVTNFGQIGAEYSLGSNKISFDYSRGKTNVNTTNNSLITGFSDLQTESFKVGYEVHKDANTSFGFTASIPSHITKGSMNLKVPSARTLDGEVLYENINSDLSNSTYEKDFGFYYKISGAQDTDANFKFLAEYRKDITGIEGKNGIALGFNYIKKLNTNCKFLWMKNPKCYNEDGSKKTYAQLYNGNKSTDIKTALALALINKASTDDWNWDSDK